MKKISIKYTIRTLRAEEWEKVRETYTAEFENAMPFDLVNNTFFGVFYDDELVGFTHIEQIFHLNAVWLNKEHRSREVVNALFETIDEKIPQNRAVIIMSEPKIKNVPKKFGFRGLDATTVWRKDFT